jgi:hypothetical protein
VVLFSYIKILKIRTSGRTQLSGSSAHGALAEIAN